MTFVDAVRLVSPFVGDSAREHLKDPFAVEVGGFGYVAASDGHRAALARCEEWRSLRDGPPLGAVVPRAPVELGEIEASIITTARLIPARWMTTLRFCDAEATTLDATVFRKQGKSETAITIFRNAPVDWAPRLSATDPWAINLRYLVEGIDFIGTHIVRVWREKSKNEAYNPIVLTPSGGDYAGADRIHVIMPVLL